MFKKLLLSFAGVLALANSVYSQSGSLTGVVSDEASGETLPAVNVYIVELDKGTVTDADGKYEITGIEYGTYTVRVTYIGYVTYQEQIGIVKNETVLDVQLAQDVLQLGDVVVTAMGIQMEKRSVGTSVQEISGDQLTQVPENNIIQSLSGKIAGVQIVGSSAASLGGTAKIRIRGASGLTETPPLFVVDGTPIDNSGYTSGTSSGVDYGSGAADINPSDVASISVLKGAAASALYGQRAAGGVVLITTKKGAFSQEKKIGITYNHSTSFENVYLLPDYQDEYAGGGSQTFLSCTDPIDGLTYDCLNYAVDESWGPRMEGQTYRPWWSWYPNETDDYGHTIALEPQKDNVRDFFDTGTTIYNNIAFDYGDQKSSYRLAVSNNTQNGVMPNSELSKTTVTFNGLLNLTEKWQSSINFNYSNTEAQERPDYGYNGDNPMSSFNQWFQRQLDIDRLEDYVADDGSFKSWNLTSHTNLTPLYWDSPYFSVYENVPEDSREHLFGNISLKYIVNENISIRGSIRRDAYTHFIEDKIASGGISLDAYSARERHRTEDNYELIADYSNQFGDFAISGLIGTNFMDRTFSSIYEGTNGGLSIPDFYDIAASIDRPTVDSYRSEEQVSSFFGTVNVGYKSMAFVDVSLRNDNASTLPSDNNSYWYGSISGSLIMTEILPEIQGNGILSFWKLRAGYGQVGSSADPYSVYDTYSVTTPYGSNPAMALPNTKPNSELKPSISDEFEYGTEIRFFDGRLYTDINYYYARKTDEIIELSVSGATGYSALNINAGKFIKKGLELTLGGIPIQTKDFAVDASLNWSTNYSEVAELYPGLTSLGLDTYVYARENEQWGTIIASGYSEDENGNHIISSGGLPTYENGKELGHLLPDWQGGLNLDFSFKNFGLHTFLEFQKGGKFYSISKRYNAYSGLGAQTVGDNELGNPVRDPVIDNAGNEVGSVLASDAAANSGGVYVSGVDTNGDPVAYYTDAKSYWKRMGTIRENWIYDASYIKLRDVRLSYKIPQTTLAPLSVKSADVSFYVKNAWLIWADAPGLDPTEATNGNTGFSFYEGGQLPGVRSIGLSLNLKF